MIAWITCFAWAASDRLIFSMSSFVLFCFSVSQVPSDWTFNGPIGTVCIAGDDRVWTQGCRRCLLFLCCSFHITCCLRIKDGVLSRSICIQKLRHKTYIYIYNICIRHVETSWNIKTIQHFDSWSYKKALSGCEDVQRWTTLRCEVDVWRVKTVKMVKIHKSYIVTCYMTSR